VNEVTATGSKPLSPTVPATSNEASSLRAFAASAAASRKIASASEGGLPFSAAASAAFISAKTVGAMPGSTTPT
jgi:hypothetical protein